MIGKFLQEEENKTSEADEIAIFEAVENKTAAPFVLPDPQTDVLNIPANAEQKISVEVEEPPVFRDSEELTEVVPLPENQEKCSGHYQIMRYCLKTGCLLTASRPHCRPQILSLHPRAVESKY